MAREPVLGAASLPFIACIALIAGAIFQILAFASTSWGYDNVRNISVGLWKDGSCLKPDYKECFKVDHVEYFSEDWLKTVRGLECLAVIFVSFPLVILPVYMYIALGLYYKCMLGIMCLCSLMSAICGLAGVVVYGLQVTDMEWETSWCLYVAMVGAAATFVAFLVLTVATFKKRPKKVVTVQKVRMYTINAEQY